jgi:hypothetical protein
MVKWSDMQAYLSITSGGRRHRGKACVKSRRLGFSGIYMHDVLARAWHARGQPTALSMHESVKKTLIVGCAPDHNPSLDLDCMSDWVGFAAAVTEVYSL